MDITTRRREMNELVIMNIFVSVYTTLCILIVVYTAMYAPIVYFVPTVTFLFGIVYNLQLMQHKASMSYVNYSMEQEKQFNDPAINVSLFDTDDFEGRDLYSALVWCIQRM